MTIAILVPIVRVWHESTVSVARLFLCGDVLHEVLNQLPSLVK